MKLSAAIMAHPKRAAMVDELLGWLDRPVPVVWDEIQDRHDTGLRALQAFDPDASHHLVIQDDVVPCRDLLAGVERLLDRVPGGAADTPVSLYVGNVRPFAHAIKTAIRFAGDHTSWLSMQGIYWGPAVVYPTAHLPALIDHFETSKVTNYDRRASKWFERRGYVCWYTWPSLVDHRGDDSLAHDAAPGRRAHRFLGADSSALDVDWSGGTVRLSHSARLDRTRQAAAR